jgi:uncharacterized protein (DUF983 family)
LGIRSRCDSFGATNTIYPLDDFPPYLSILAVGHVLVRLMSWMERAFMPTLWLQTAIFQPLTALLCLTLLPVMKGGTVGLCCATGLVRQGV